MRSSRSLTYTFEPLLPLIEIFSSSTHTPGARSSSSMPSLPIAAGALATSTTKRSASRRISCALTTTPSICVEELFSTMSPRSLSASTRTCRRTGSKPRYWIERVYSPVGTFSSKRPSSSVAMPATCSPPLSSTTVAYSTACPCSSTTRPPAGYMRAAIAFAAAIASSRIRRISFFIIFCV